MEHTHLGVWRRGWKMMTLQQERNLHLIQHKVPV